MSRIPTKARLLVAARSAERCEGCGAARACEIHHRSPRGMGGGDGHNLGNLLHLCHGCHRVIESERSLAYTMGWLLSPGKSAEAEKTLVKYRGRIVYLLDDGTVKEVTTHPGYGQNP